MNWERSVGGVWRSEVADVLSRGVYAFCAELHHHKHNGIPSLAHHPRRQEKMQVHAVPDAERAFDSQGRRLPWGLEYAE